MRNLSEEHLVIVRTNGSIVNFDSYNNQEIGLAKALITKGLRVTYVLAGNENSDTVLHEDEGDIRILRVKTKAIHHRYSWFDKIEDRLLDIKPTLIQVHDMDVLMTWRCVKWAKKQAIPCYLIQGPYDVWRFPILRQFNEIYNRTFGKYILNNVSGIGVKTSLAAKYLNKYAICNTRQTTIGLDLSPFKHAAYIDWKHSLDIDSNKKVLLYVGSLQPRRNPMFLLDLISKLSDEYVLLIAGVGSQEENLKQRIKAEGLNGKCYMLGKLAQNQLPSLYTQANCFLLASDYEIYGMVLMEAMYFGCPVISTKTGGAMSIITERKNGFLIDGLDLDKWEACICSIFSDEKNLLTVSSAAKQKIATELTWTKTCEEFLKLYFGEKYL